MKHSSGGKRFCGYLFRAFAVALTLLILCACEDPLATETSMFEAAEVHYRLGNYDAALSGYQDFLRRYPGSPLANTAEMRVRNIGREVSSVMERPGSPRPVYHGLNSDQSTSTPQEESLPADFLPPDP